MERRERLKRAEATFKASGAYYQLAVASKTKSSPQSREFETAESNGSSGGPHGGCINLKSYSFSNREPWL
jgi:hypothetical protein